MINYILVAANGYITGYGNILNESDIFNPNNDTIYLIQYQSPYNYYIDGQFQEGPQPQADVEAQVLSKRSALLQGSDWTQLPDVPLTDEQKAAWATYRQELRDIPQQSGYPYNVVWPTPPQ